MNGNHTERLSQESECRNEEEYGILESASAFAHRVLEEIEVLAGTTDCKSVQPVRLKKWAQEQGTCTLLTQLFTHLIRAATKPIAVYRQEQVQKRSNNNFSATEVVVICKGNK